MRFSDAQIRRIAETLLVALVDHAGATLKVDRSAVLAKIESAFRANLQEEESLEQDARKLLEVHLRQTPPGVDRQRVLQMIKKRLADERGIPL